MSQEDEPNAHFGQVAALKNHSDLRDDTRCELRGVNAGTNQLTCTYRCHSARRMVHPTL